MTKQSRNLFTLALLAILSLTGLSLGAQTVSGTVTDADGGGPLVGVTVLLEGSGTGTVTDFDGKYSIAAKPGDALTFSYTGMESQSITVGNATTLDVILAASNIALEQVIVTAYGTSKKGAFTGSAAQINAEDIANRPIANISDAINGAPGIQYSPSSGQPGASSPIRVRGFGSVNASADPLYVVDGIIFSGSLNSINPSDVESITVLKDAASTALYGAKAANGVVLVTTKSGRSGKPTFNVSLNQGFTGRAIPEYERIGPGDYYELQWEALRNGFVSGGTELAEANQLATDQIVTELGTNPFNVPDNQVVGTDGQLNPSAQLLYPDDLDWQDPLVRQGNRSEANLSYQGGTDQTKYFTSIGYINEDGWIIGSDFQRFSGRVNVSTSPVSWIRTGLNANIASSTANQAADGGSTSFVNPFFATRNIAPIYPVFEHDPITGEFLLDDAGERIYDLGDNRIGNTNGRHVILETLLNRDRDKTNTVGARAFVDFSFLNDFTLTLNAGYDNRGFATEVYGNTTVGDAFPLGRAIRRDVKTSSLTLNQLLTYEKDFGVHNVKVLAGHESFEYERNFLSAERIGQIASGNTELINFATLDDATSNTRRYTTEGYLARAEYDFDNRYFLSASFRADGSSRFAEDVRWGEFYSVGVAWRLDQETFAQNLGIFDLLKLRASYGEVGNDSNLDFNALSFFASQPLLDLGNNNATEPGVLVGSLGAPLLEWETNAQTDVALEFGMFDYRLNGTIEYYNRETSNLIFDVPLPLSTGSDDQLANIGAMFNRGIEVSLSGDIIRSSNFTWTLDINASTISNEFKELPQEEIITGTKKLVVGGSIYDYFLREYYGVDPENGDPLFYLDPESDFDDPNVRIISGDTLTSIANDARRGFVGTAIPDLFGAITNKFTIGNFRLGFLLTYQIGGKTYDSNHARLLANDNYGSSLGVEALDRWQQPGDVTDVPRRDGSKDDGDFASSRFLIDSDFLALRQANLTYIVPTNLLRNIGLSALSVYASGENLFIDTARTGMDVNQNFNGTTQNRFTPTRTITFGLNATF